MSKIIAIKFCLQKAKNGKYYCVFDEDYFAHKSTYYIFNESFDHEQAKIKLKSISAAAHYLSKKMPWQELKTLTLKNSIPEPLQDKTFFCIEK